MSAPNEALAMPSSQFNSPAYAQTPESCGNSTSEESCVYSRSTSISEPDDSEIGAKQRDSFHKWRPKVHLIAPTGWLNDPCAPGYDRINDCYHIGFQWNPDSAEWGNICWGAAVSRDLLSWDISREPSIVPSVEESEGGVFTGCLSPVELHPGKLTAFYTSAKILPIHHTLPYNHGSEGLHLATSTDSGRTWNRYEKNPVLPGPPSDLKVTGWRDPFVSVWPSLARTLGDPDTTLYGIVSGGLLGQGPTPFIYRLDRKDITKWEFLSSLVSLTPNFSPSPSWPTDNGVNWEVTNFLSLEDPDDTRTHDFLIMGVEGRLSQEWNKGRSAFSVDHGQLWMCGKLKADEGKPVMDYIYGGCLDHGSYYAGNSFWDPKTQQQIIIGWVIEEDLSVELRKRQGWAGLLSLPRVLKLQRLRGVSRALATPLEQIPSIGLRQDGMRGGEQTYEVTTLCAVPDDRLSSLRGSLNSFSTELSAGSDPMPRFDFSAGCPALEVLATFEVASSVLSAGLRFTFAGHACITTVVFDSSSERLRVQRHQSTIEPDIVVVDEVAPHTLFEFANGSVGTASQRELLSFRIIFDVSVMEIFANDRTALTTRLYADVPKVIAVEPIIIGKDGMENINTSGLRDFKCWELNNRA